jgi:hypothetical protein
VIPELPILRYHRGMTRGLFILVGMTGIFGAPAFAQDAPPVTTAVCTNAGTQYKVGEYACIAACHGQRRLARCDAAAQSASWTYVSDACPSAMINPAWPSDWTETPALSEMTPIPVTVRMSAIDPKIAPLIGSHFRQNVVSR